MTGGTPTTTETARVVVLERYGEPPRPRDVPLRPPAGAEVLVAVQAATVCGTDVHIAAGRFPGASTLPLALGHEGVGAVVAVGPERRTDALGRPLREGDLVVWDHPWCGRCRACTVDRQPTLCRRASGYGWGPFDGRSLNGTFATHVHVAGPSNLLRVPAGLDPTTVSTATCALRTVMHAVERSGPIGFSDRVVVLGAGAVGLYAAAVALAAGAYDVVLVGAPATRLAATDGWGLGLRLDLDGTTAAERVEAVLARSAGRGADLVIECAGPAAAFSEGMAMVRPGGRFLVLGQASGEDVPVDTTALKIRQITVQTSLSATIAHYHQALCFLERHGDRFGFERLTAGPHHGLDEVTTALDAVAAGDQIRPVVGAGAGAGGDGAGGAAGARGGADRNGEEL